MHQQNTPVICPSCNAVYTGSFCSNCGEKKIDRHDFSIRHFVEESIEGFTHFDNRFLRSLKLLIIKPGLLTKYYFEGRRIPFMKPLQLFIVCNIIFFFLLGKSNVFAVSFYNYRNFTPFIYFGTQQAIAAKAQTQDQLLTLATIFNERMSTVSKSFLILFIPVFALFFSLFFFNKKKYFTEHLVFATHFFSFLILYYVALRFAAELPFTYFSHKNYSSTFDFIVSLTSLLLLSFYFGIAAKRFYSISNAQAVITGILMAIAFIVCIYTYRMFLFYKIIYSIH
ncbi:MAG: DUF3667 domain-containing protein [Ferruginibacter sp.]